MKRKFVFANLDSALRKKVSEMIRAGRQRDHGEKITGRTWLCQERSLEEYCQRLGVHRTYLQFFLRNRLVFKKNVRILDIGVGRGRAFLELSQEFGDKISCWGIALTHRSHPEIPSYRHRVGLIETLPLEKQFFDLIFSVRGGFSYTIHSFAAIEEALNALTTGGMALLEDTRLLLTQDWFREFLISHGFEVAVTRYDAGRPVAGKYLRRSTQDLDLSRFGERYLSYLNQNKTMLIQWGMDRVEAKENLNDFFQEAYSLHHYQDLISP